MPILAMQLQQKSLEDIFLELTGDDGSDQSGIEGSNGAMEVSAYDNSLQIETEVNDNLESTATKDALEATQAPKTDKEEA